MNERNREELDEVSNKRLTSMAYDIAKGLEYLAEQKYVHRDIACRFVSNLHPAQNTHIDPCILKYLQHFEPLLLYNLLF